jgi:hypothetical protein
VDKIDSHKFDIESISPHLFWDVKPSNLDAKTNKVEAIVNYELKFITKRKETIRKKLKEHAKTLNHR